MKSILKTFNAGFISNFALIGILSVLTTACGSDADSSDPRRYDINGPEIVLNPVDGSIAMKDDEGNATKNVIIHIGTEFLMTVDDTINVVNGKVMEKDVEGNDKHTGAYVETGAEDRDVWDVNNIDSHTTELYKLLPETTCQILTDTSPENDNLAIIAETVDTTSPAIYCVIYSSSDTSGNLTKSARTITVADLVAPEITIDGPNPILLENNEIFTLPSASYVDAFDSSNGTNANADPITIPSENIVNPVDTSITNSYEVTYTAFDVSGNKATAILTVVVEPSYRDEIVVFKGGDFGADFDAGMNAYDEGNPSWGTCSQSSGCPNISFELVQDEERGTVIEIEHADTIKSAGVFIESRQTVDLRGAAETGKLMFDVWSENGISINYNVGCVYPCESPTFTRENVGVGEWETITVPAPSLLTGKLNLNTLSKVNTFGIHATSQTNATFRVDNIMWKCENSCDGSSVPDKEYTPWVKVEKTVGYNAPTSYDGYDLVWWDEFDGNQVDTTKWNLDTGCSQAGCGNEESQHYRPENASVEDGLLAINVEIQEEGDAPLPNRESFSSAKLTTKGLYEFKHGRVDIRAAVAEGKGMWSAGWMLGANVDVISWPYSGEIDIFETIGGTHFGKSQEERMVHNAYWNKDGPNAPAPYSASSYSPTPSSDQKAWGVRVIGNDIKDDIPENIPGETFSNTFHVFSIEWDEEKIRYMIDDEYVEGKDLDLSTSGAIPPCEYGQAPNQPELSCIGQSFNNDFFLILNVAVEGTFPGVIDDTTQFPRGMLVDYVRVYQTAAQKAAQ
jgi:beta-glucanase (GH16 family)